MSGKVNGKQAIEISDPTHVHATKQLLLESVCKMLQTENPIEITSEKVLAQTHVSTGSLYHHFEDFNDLMEQALCIEYESVSNKTIELLIGNTRNAKNLKAWVEGINEGRKVMNSPSYARNRVLKLWAVAYASSSDRMRVKLGEAQDRLNAKFVSFVDEAKTKGWLASDSDSKAIAVFVQAYQLGAILNDVSLDKLKPELWTDVVEKVIKRSFLQ